MERRLKLRSYMSVRRSLVMGTGRTFGYKVDGLLPEQGEARVIDRGNEECPEWYILRIKDGLVTELPSTYQSAEEALMALVGPQ